MGINIGNSQQRSGNGDSLIAARVIGGIGNLNLRNLPGSQLCSFIGLFGAITAIQNCGRDNCCGQACSFYHFLYYHSGNDRSPALKSWCKNHNISPISNKKRGFKKGMSTEVLMPFLELKAF